MKGDVVLPFNKRLTQEAVERMTLSQVKTPLSCVTMRNVRGRPPLPGTGITAPTFVFSNICAPCALAKLMCAAFALKEGCCVGGEAEGGGAGRRMRAPYEGLQARHLLDRGLDRSAED